METYVGIDVSKRKFDMAILEDSSCHSFEMTTQDIRNCIQLLRKYNVVLVAMEATGGYEHQLFIALANAGFDVAIANPRQVRDFARAVGKLAKTDKIDASVIALMAAALRPKPTALPDENCMKLRALATRRRQLVCMLIAENNRLEHVQEKHVKQTHRKLIATIEKQLVIIDQQMNDMIQASPALCRIGEILQSVPGIGEKSAMHIIADLPELGKASRREIASLVGLAPMNRDSGTMRGKRTTGGGRKIVRTMLFMPTLVATRCNPVIREYYQKLLARGKTKMVALVACMRKLLTILNALVAKNEIWDPLTT